MDEKPRSAWTWWASQPLPLKISVFVVAITVFLLIWWLLPPLLYAGTSDTDVKAVTDTRTALLAGLVGVGALGTLWINNHNVGLTAEIHAHTVKDATERRVTELYTKAADQLGSDKAPVRLAGLYALERLAQDNPTQRPTIVNVICAYLQMPYTPPGPLPVEPRGEQEREWYEKRLYEYEKRAQEQRVRTIARRILLRHFSRTSEESVRWPEATIDLSRANLAGATLTAADLREARLAGANLSGANLTHALLDGANLSRATWTKETTWPEELRGTIEAESEDAGGDYFRIRKGYRVPG